MRKPYAHDLHSHARILRARAMRILARQALRAGRRWVYEVLVQPFVDPLSA
jgi:hypothetical protein